MAQEPLILKGNVAILEVGSVSCYINGVMSGVVQYPADDDFSQVTPADITIGSSQCTIDLYCIQVYDNDLSPQQMEDNWIADTQPRISLDYPYNILSQHDSSKHAAV